MILYRLAKCVYIHDFSGAGAQRYGGRWNSVGRPMVYLAASRALAVLEVLVHLPPTLLPGSFCLAEVEIPVATSKLWHQLIIQSTGKTYLHRLN